MTVKIYVIHDIEMLNVDNYTLAVLTNLRNQGAPIDDNLKLQDGWKMKLLGRDTNTESTIFKIFDEDE